MPTAPSREQDLRGRAGHRGRRQDDARDRDRTSSAAGQRSRQARWAWWISSRPLGRDHRSASDECGTGAGVLIARARSRFPTVSSVWIVCDVYENDMPNVRLGDTADITLNAYPDRPFKGKVSNIGIDPRSQHPHRQGSHRSAESRDHAAGHVRDGDIPRPDHRDAHHCPGVRRSCICTIAILFSSPRPTRSFAAWKWSVETC